MPNRSTIERAERDKREGKAPTTQAGEFVREEFHHIEEGKHGARSPEQAIAIGLSKARRAGVELKPPGEEQSEETRAKASRDYAREHGAPARSRSTPKRRTAASRALKRESRAAGSTRAISGHAKSAARRRSAASRSAAARKASRTKGRASRSARSQRSRRRSR
jgi:hypothetical protein